MKNTIKTIIDIPFIIFIYICTTYFLLKNLTYLKSIDTISAMQKINEFAEKSFPFFLKVKPHIIGAFWVTILLIIVS
jgi:hypothetical protein